jgi:hypothetical protein
LCKKDTEREIWSEREYFEMQTTKDIIRTVVKESLFSQALKNYFFKVTFFAKKRPWDEQNVKWPSLRLFAASSLTIWKEKDKKRKLLFSLQKCFWTLILIIQQTASLEQWKYASIMLQAVFKEIQAKPIYNDPPWDPKIVAVVYRWSLFKGHLCNKSYKWDNKIVVVVDRWSLFGGGR